MFCGIFISLLIKMQHGCLRYKSTNIAYIPTTNMQQLAKGFKTCVKHDYNSYVTNPIL